MGTSASSTRRAEFINDDPTSVIKVSEDVVERIKGSQVAPSKITIKLKLEYSHYLKNSFF